MEGCGYMADKFIGIMDFLSGVICVIMDIVAFIFVAAIVMTVLGYYALYFIYLYG